MKQQKLVGFRPQGSLAYSKSRKDSSITHASAVQALIPPWWMKLRLLSRDDFHSKVVKPLSDRLRRMVSEEPTLTVVPRSPSRMFEVLHRITDPSSIRVIIVCGDVDASGVPFSDEESRGHILRELHKTGVITRDDCDSGSFDLNKWMRAGVIVLPVLWTRWDKDSHSSHAGWGWERFTTTLIRAIMEVAPVQAVLLWGHMAQSVCRAAISERVPVLLSGAPSTWKKSPCMHFVNPATRNIQWGSIVDE